MKNFDLFIKDFSDLISAKSVKDQPKPGMPFGEGVDKAYTVFKGIASRLGFDVVDYDGYMGEITVGSGKELGIIGHLDVVPAPVNGWNTDPFTLTKVDGVYYGRGVADDKGPLLLCLYALKDVIEEYGLPKRKVRFLIGLDEESGWADVDYFKTKSVMPEEGFSPDGNFPVVYAEKGPSRIEFKHPYNGQFTNFKGGTVVNAVCDYASVNGPIDEVLLKKYNLSHNGNLIESFGKSAHGSKPELGKNAILPLLKYVDEIEQGSVTPLIKYLFDDVLNITTVGNETGYATMSPDIIDYVDGCIKIIADFRVPAKMLLEDFIPTFSKMGIDFVATKGRDPLFVDKNSQIVQGLLDAYNTVTGENAEPYSCSGATFSSVFNSGVAFGPEFEDADGAIHQPNEYVSEVNLIKMYNIYKKALINLITK
jgi:succinyl-diaminopimelate desuccinylase